MLGGDEIGLRLALVARRGADVGRLDHRERVAAVHLRAERAAHGDDATGHGREHVARAHVVERHASAREDCVVDVLLRERRDVDLRVLDLLIGEPHLSGRWVDLGRDRRVMARDGGTDDENGSDAAQYDHDQNATPIEKSKRGLRPPFA